VLLYGPETEQVSAGNPALAFKWLGLRELRL
jgi:hypothetical protein